jgi:hypothetical protein
VIGVAITVGSLAAAAGAAMIDEPGDWSLRRLGERSFAIPIHPGGHPQVKFHYRLPDDASQGHPYSYLVQLDFEITFRPGDGRGWAYVDASTNGRAAAQIEFHRRPGQPTHLATFGLVRGPVNRRLSSRSAEVHFKNFLQLSGVRPGGNTLRVRLDEIGHPRVEHVRVRGKSGLIVSRRGPPKLAVALSPPKHPPQVGDRFPLRYRLRNVGDRPARGVHVAFSGNRGGLHVLGRSRRTLDIVRGNVSGRFFVESSRPGSYRPSIHTISSAGNPAAQTALRVLAKPQQRPWTPARYIWGGVLAAAGASLILLGRRRKLVGTR